MMKIPDSLRVKCDNVYTLNKVVNLLASQSSRNDEEPNIELGIN